MLPERWVRGAGIAGTVALLAGLILFFQDGEISTRVFLLLAASAAGLSIWVIFAPEDLRAFFSGRQAVSGTVSVIMSILLVALVVVVYVVIERQDMTVDFTDELAFTLSPQSETAIERIVTNGRPTQLIGFYSRDYLREQEAADVILRQYDAQGGDMLDVLYVDPDRQPELARQFLYHTLDNKVHAIYAAFVLPDGSYDMSSVRYIGSTNERIISTELLQMTALTEAKFYFTTGHTELDINSQAGTGLARAVVALDFLNIGSAEINLLTDDIPEDATALVIAGPSSAFDESEVEKIAAYMANGGRLVVMANPPYIDATFGGVSTPVMQDSALGQYLWDEFGVRFRDDLIYDPGSSFEEGFLPVPAGYNFAVQDILGDEFIGSTSVIFQLARSVEIATEPEGAQTQYIRQWLMHTSDNSYGETTLQEFEGGDLTNFEEETDIPGPLFLGAAVRSISEINQEYGARLILVGDIDWLTNDILTRFEGNAYLWSQFAVWLASTSDRALPDAGIQQDLLPISATQQERQRVSLLTTVIMPGMVLLTGALVWYRRRRG